MADNTFDMPDDTEFSTGDPVKGSHPQKIKDAIINNLSLTHGIDGALTFPPSGGPVPHASGITITAGATLGQALNVIFVKGDFELQTGQTMTVPQYDTASVTRYIGDNLSILAGGNSSGVYAAGQAGSGAGGYGDGGTTDNTAGTGWGSSLASGAWRAMTHLVGGYAVQDDGTTVASKGGGSLILIVDGNVTIAGTIEAKGENGGLDGSNDEEGGGGGGSVRIYCTGAFDGTGGTIDVSGGDGYQPIAAAGGGGGGYIGIVSPTITSATYTISGGDGNGNDGANGLNEEVSSLTASEIRAFIKAAGVAA